MLCIYGAKIPLEYAVAFRKIFLEKESIKMKGAMKKVLLCALVFTMEAGAVFADPVGLRVYTDGVSFGNVAAEGYKFAGDGGLARIPLGLEFSKALGPVNFSTALEYALSFTATPSDTGDPKHQPQWNLSGSYSLQLAEASKLGFSLYNKLHFDASKGGEFADNIWDDMGPGIRFDQTFGFGSLYAVTELSVRIYTYENTDGSDKGLGLKPAKISASRRVLTPILAFMVMSGPISLF
jgi:hypothetical protein